MKESISVDIEVGDIMLGGKFKNKKVEVEEIGEDKHGDPTINGKPLLRFRTPKKKMKAEEYFKNVKIPMSFKKEGMWEDIFDKIFMLDDEEDE